MQKISREECVVPLNLVQLKRHFLRANFQLYLCVTCNVHDFFYIFFSAIFLNLRHLKQRKLLIGKIRSKRGSYGQLLAADIKKVLNPIYYYTLSVKIIFKLSSVRLSFIWFSHFFFSHLHTLYGRFLYIRRVYSII